MRTIVGREIILGVLTFISTIITGDYIMDIFVGIFTYTSARVFYHYHKVHIIKFIDWIKKLFTIK